MSKPKLNRLLAKTLGSDAQGHTTSGTCWKVRKVVMPYIVGVQPELPLYEGEMVLRDALEEMDHRGGFLQLITPGFQDSDTGAQFQVDDIFYRKDIRPGV